MAFSLSPLIEEVYSRVSWSSTSLSNLFCHLTWVPCSPAGPVSPSSPSDPYGVKKKNRLSVVFVVGLSRGREACALWNISLSSPLPLPLPTASLVNPPAVSHRRKMDPRLSMVCHKHILEQALYIQVCDRLDFQFRTLMAINDIGTGRTFCAHTFIPGFPSRPWLPTGPAFPCNEQ